MESCKEIYYILISNANTAINWKTMASKLDIKGKLVLNTDQDEFRKLAEEAVRKLTKIKKVDGKNKRIYSDFVLTIDASVDKRTFNVYRNRTSMLVLSERDYDVISISFEYIYVEDHIKYLLKELDGKGKGN